MKSPEERAATILPCADRFSCRPAIGYEAQHHEWVCPVYYRPAVAAALRAYALEVLDEVEAKVAKFARIAGTDDVDDYRDAIASVRREWEGS